MEIRGTSCILYVHKHIDTFPRDDEYGCAQYDDEGVHEEHNIWGSADLQTSLQSSLTKEGPGDVRTPWGFTLARVGSCVGKYYTSIVVQDWRPPLNEIKIRPKSIIACICICMTSYSGVTY